MTRILTLTYRLTAPAVLALLVTGAASPLFGQATVPLQAAQPPQAPAEGYVPQEGQEGKDVVWVPTPEALVQRMLDIANVSPKDYLIDLGAGDGRTVIAAAKRGVRAHGIEYNPDMVALAKQRAIEAGVTGMATFEEADLFQTDLSKATVITMFLLPSINLELRPRLLDLAPGTRIVSNTFTMEAWEPDQRSKVEEDCTSWCTALLWIVPARAAGAWQIGGETLTLAQDFQTVRGSLGSAAVEDGKLAGTSIRFRVGERVYEGQVNGDTITGTVGGTPFRATRRAE